MCPKHFPVMCDEVVEALAPAAGEVFVDGTFGAGGYSLALLKAADCRVFAIDRDPDAVAAARDLPESAAGSLTVLPGRFADMVELLADAGVTAVDGITLDLGVSSMQIDDPDRGFSFQQDGPLDMRMERQGESAADLVNEADEAELADIIFQYGEERRSRAIARAIVRARDQALITRTGSLADIVTSVLGPGKGQRAHPATRTFQALRIYVNRELEQLDRALVAAERLLKSGGRLVIVAFHSLEDRRIKTFLQERSGAVPSGSRHLPPDQTTRPAPTFVLPRRGVLKPAAAEIAANPRSRSARLRAAVRTDAPPWSDQVAA